MKTRDVSGRWSVPVSTVQTREIGEIVFSLKSLITEGYHWGGLMLGVKVLDYFCRIEEEELVCVARLRAGDRYLHKEFREKLEEILGEVEIEEGALGC
jgi:hypothetical protein